MSEALQYNPQLKRWLHSEPNNTAGKGYVEKPGEVENIIWQNRGEIPTEYENRLGDALEVAFEAGAEDLSAIVASLNDQGIYTQSGERWTEEVFEQEIHRLGA